MPPGTFADFENIRQIYLNANNVKTVKSGTFCNYAKLWNISLSHNKIRSMELGCFDGHPSLRCLNMANSDISGTGPASVAIPFGIGVLNLSDNKITSIAKDNLDAVKDSLEMLYIDNKSDC